MKKFLFSIAALALALTANAQTVADAYDAEAGTLTLTFTPGEQDLSAFTVYVKAEGYTVKVKKSTCSFLSIQNEDEEDLFNWVSWSNTSNYPEEGYGVFGAYSKPITVMPAGTLGVLTLTAGDNPSGSVTYVPTFSTPDSKSFKLDPVTVDLNATAVQKVAAQSEVAAPAKRFENGQVVVYKNGKKFSAAGAQMK